MADTAVIVVGVDGSPESQDALEFALREAAFRQASVRAVTAYDPPDPWGIVYAEILSDDLSEITTQVAAETRIVVDEVLSKIGGAAADVPIEVVAEAGSATHVLLTAAADADLLVVGHRGRGGFTSMLLGSVGLQCVLHAPCPVTVVRPTESTVENSSPPGSTYATP